MLLPQSLFLCLNPTLVRDFRPRLEQVVALATELVKWYRAHENSTWHIIDPDLAATCANGAGSGHVDGEIEGESSDGEMDG